MNSKINQQILLDAEKNFFNNLSLGSNGKFKSNGINKKNDKNFSQKNTKNNLNFNNNNNTKLSINASAQKTQKISVNNNKGKLVSNNSNLNKQTINSKQISKNNQNFAKNNNKNIQPEFLLKGTQIQQNKNHLDKIDPNRLSKEGFYTTLPKNNNSLNNSKNSFYNSSLTLNNNNNNNSHVNNNNNSHVNINNKKEKMLITSITNNSKINNNNNKSSNNINNNNTNKQNNNNNTNKNNNNIIINKSSNNINNNKSSNNINNKNSNNINNNNKNNKTNSLNKSMSRSLKFFNLQNLENEDLNENSFSSSKNIFENIVEQQKNNQYHDIKQFLSNMNLDYLFPNFAKNKIFTNSQIENLTEKELQKMKIPKENINLILDRIEEIKNLPNMNYNDDGFGTQCDININDPVVNNIEENERIQSELFKKAVEEFRKMGKKNENNENNENDENNNNNIKIDAKKFLFEIGNSDFLNLNKLSLFSDQANDVKDDEDFIPELNVGKACWNCYKQIKQIYPINFEQKFFCCEKCLNDYVNKNTIKCDYCGKNIIKFRQILFGNKKYCSMECYNEDRNKIVEEENEDDNNNNNNNNNNFNAGVDKIIKAKDIIKNSNKNNNINNDVIDILDI